MPPGKPRLPSLTDNQIQQLLADFKQHRKAISCPKCSTLDSINRYGNNKADPPMPTFLCAKCSKYLNHVQLQEGVTQAIKSNTNSMQQNQMTATPHTPALVLEHQDALPEYIKKIVNELNEQRERINEHDRLYNEINRLTEELSTAHERIAELEAINSRLNARLNETPATQNSTPAFMDHEFPTLSNLSQQQLDLTDSLWADSQRTQSLRATLPTKTNPEKLQRRQTAAARMFSPPSATHGYKYIYYPA
ncbi:hypothetical protein DFQ29_010085, partial [Apophysomyces sp. BC1021]